MWCSGSLGGRRVRRSLPRAFDSIDFYDADLLPDDKGMVSKLSERDLVDGRLVSRFDNDSERRLVIANSNFDLLSSVRLREQLPTNSPRDNSGPMALAGRSSLEIETKRHRGLAIPRGRPSCASCAAGR